MVWVCIYSSTSKWSDRASFFTIPSNECWKVLSQIERSTKHRADFILLLTNKEGYNLLEEWNEHKSLGFNIASTTLRLRWNNVEATLYQDQRCATLFRHCPNVGWKSDVGFGLIFNVGTLKESWSDIEILAV